MRRPHLTILLSLIISVTVCSTSALAFRRDVRCQIVRDAVEFAPKGLQNYLVEHFENIHNGIHHIDLVGHKKIKPYDAKKIYQALLNNIKKGNTTNYNTTQRFGVLAGYLAETVSPSQFRGTRDLIPGWVAYDGFHRTDNIHQSISRIIRDYRNPYLGQNQRKITDFLYSVAVNEIVDHWVTLWEAGGQATGELKIAGADIKRTREADRLRGVRAGGVRDSVALVS